MELGSLNPLIVLKRSSAEIPVVTPSPKRSTEAVNCVSISLSTPCISDSFSFFAISFAIGAQTSPFPYVIIKFICSGKWEVLNELYEQLKSKVSNFSEIDIEMEESKTHLKRSIVQSIRDVRMSGAITKAEQEYLEQIGVNPMKMQNLIRQYVKQEEESTSWDNKGLYDFVDGIVKDLIDNHKVDIVRMEYMGFDSKPVENMSYDTTVARRIEGNEQTNRNDD